MKTKQTIITMGALLTAIGAILTVNLQAGEKAGGKFRDFSNLNASSETQGGSGCCHQMMPGKCKVTEAKGMECKKMGTMKCGMKGNKDQVTPSADQKSEHHH